MGGRLPISLWGLLALADGVRAGRKRVERLIRQAAISGLIRRRRGRTTIRVPGARAAVVAYLLARMMVDGPASAASYSKAPHGRRIRQRTIPDWTGRRDERLIREADAQATQHGRNGRLGSGR